MRRLVVILAALMVLLSGCKLRLELATSVEEDGSGTVALAFGVDDRFRELFESFGSAFGEEEVDLFEEMRADVPPGWEVEDYEHDDVRGLRVTTDFDSVEDLEEKLREAEAFDTESSLGGGVGDDIAPPDASDGGPGSELSDGFSLTREGEVFRFEFDADDAGLGEDSELATPDSDEGDFEGFEEFAEGLADFEAEVIVQLELPGKVLEHNADQKDANTLVWELEPGTSKTLSAVSDASQSEGGDGFPVVPVVIGVLVVAGIVGGFLLARRRGTPAGPEGGDADSIGSAVSSASELGDPPPGSEPPAPPGPPPPPD